MKKILGVMLSILFTLSITGCNNGAEAPPTISATRPTTFAAPTEVVSKVLTTTSVEMTYNPSTQPTTEESATTSTVPEITATNSYNDYYLDTDDGSEFEGNVKDSCSDESNFSSQPTKAQAQVTPNVWGLVSASTEVETSTGSYTVEKGCYILIVSEYDNSYTIAWYGDNATIPCNCVSVLENVSTEHEEEILQSRTAGVIEP